MAAPLIDATLELERTSKNCVAYRLHAGGSVVWRNRPYPTQAGHTGARARMAAWATRNGYRIVEPQGTDEERAPLLKQMQEARRQLQLLGGRLEPLSRREVAALSLAALMMAVDVANEAIETLHVEVSQAARRA